MPRILINTNIKDADLPANFEDDIAKKISEVLEYPLELVYISISTGNRMLNNGKKTPMVFVDIESVDRFNKDKNPGYTKIFFPYITSLLSLPETRIVIKYHDAHIPDFGVVRKAPEFQHEQYFVDI